MQFRCNDTLFPIEGNLRSSRLITYMMRDIGDMNNSIIPIPNEYYDCFMNLSSSKLQDKAKRLELYNFLEVDEIHIEKICKEIGVELSIRKENIQMNHDCWRILMSNYCLLYYYKSLPQDILTPEFEKEIKSNPAKFVNVDYHENYRGFSFLDYVKCGNLSMVKYLHQHGAKIKYKAIYQACINGHVNILKYFQISELISKSTIINLLIVTIDYGQTNTFIHLHKISNIPVNSLSKKIILKVISNGNLFILQYLVSLNIKITDELINESCRSGHLEIVKYLLSQERYLCINYALYIAYINGHLEIIKYLYDQGAKLYDNDKTIKIVLHKEYFNILEFHLTNFPNKYIENYNDFFYDVLTESNTSGRTIEFLITYAQQHMIYVDYAKLLPNLIICGYKTSVWKSLLNEDTYTPSLMSEVFACGYVINSLNIVKHIHEYASDHNLPIDYSVYRNVLKNCNYSYETREYLSDIIPLRYHEKCFNYIGKSIKLYYSNLLQLSIGLGLLFVMVKSNLYNNIIINLSPNLEFN